MIRIILACFFLLFSFNAFAQQDPPPSLYEGGEKGTKKIMPELPKLWLNLNTGLAFSQGQYASAVEYERAGYAQTGIEVSTDIGYKLFKFGGLNFEAAWCHNPYNNKAFVFDVNNLSNETNFTSNNTLAWQHFYCLAGPYFALASNDIMIEIAIKGGYARSWLPQTKLTAADNTGYTYQRNALQGGGPAYGACFRLNRKINKHWYAALKGSYLFSAPAIHAEIVSNGLNYHFEAYNTYKQPVNIVSLSLGMTYVFRKKIRFSEEE